METQPNRQPARIFGLAMMVLGVAGGWYNWYLATNEGEFSTKLCVFTPLALVGGLLMALRPEWAGPWQADSTPAHKRALIAVVAFMALGSGLEFFWLHREVNRQAPPQKVIAWKPEMGRPTLPLALATRVVEASAPVAVSFLGRQYRLGSYNERNNRMWEFVTGGETVNNWTTLLTLIDRPDARSRQDLDRLAEGILATYRSRGAKILMARTMTPRPDMVFNYAIAAFEEPKQQRYELNFVKMQLGADHANVAVYGVRIADPQDYRTKARAFVEANSSEIGRALENLPMPDLATLPRREF